MKAFDQILNKHAYIKNHEIFCEEWNICED